ncbi:MAG: DinB family protein [Acidobacteriia bacterium]|nr:DinB family protein [Terriglobia bacterium]
MNDFAERLRSAVAHEEPLLRAIADSSAGAGPGVQRWSKKQELGHLIDSATNNRVRFVKASLEGRFEGPSYEPRGWVDLGGYAEMPWAELVALWKALNSALATLVSRIPEERRTAECRIGESLSAPLEFVVDDYIQHMQHHLDHILSREQVRSYPSAKQ